MARLDRHDAALRASIAANLDLIDVFRARNAGSREAEMLASHVRAQVHSLIRWQEARLHRKPVRWSAIRQATGVAAVTGLLLYVLWRPEHWTTWLLFLLVAGIGLLTFMGVLSAPENPRNPGAPEPVVSPDGPFVELRRPAPARSETTVILDP